MKRTNVVRLLVSGTQKTHLRLIGDRVSSLWNSVNFLCRQRFFGGKKVPSYCELCREFKDDENYRALPSHIAQEVLKKVSKAWKGYLRLKKLHEKGRLKDKPGLPGYRKNRKTGTRPFNYVPIKSTGAYSIVDDFLNITLPSDLRRRNGDRLSIPYRGILRYRGEFKTCELKYDPSRKVWYTHIVVEVPEPARKERPVRYATADLGAKRTMAVTIEGCKVSYVFSGRQLWKDYKYWTGQISREQKRLSQQGLETSRRLRRLYRKRHLRLRHAQEALAKKVAGILRKNGVTHFMVGYPKDCRESMDFGRNNQKVHNFWNFLGFIRILEKHCERRGILLERIDESGTSEVCHLCKRTVRRPVRSEVICPVHGRTHADVNAALNMLGRFIPGYRNGLEASLVWVTHEWNRHLWVPRTESLRYVSQVLGQVA